MEVSRLLTRREALGAVSAAGAALAFGCGSDSPTSPSSASSSTTTTTSTNAACAVTPTETIGPYPSLVDLFRSDIREDRAGTLLKSIPADRECVKGEEASQPFLAQSGFAVSGEPYYGEAHWYGTVQIHGEKHHLLIFPRNVKGADSAAILLIDADAGANLQLDTGGTIIVEN